MARQHILKVTLVLFSIVFLTLQFLRLEYEAAGMRALLLLMLTLLYYYTVKSKRSFFFLFLIIFTIAEFFDLVSWYIDISNDEEDYLYYFINGLYIVSYMFLITHVVSTMNIKQVVLRLPIHIVILTVLGVFCVTVVTNTTEAQLPFAAYIVEYMYNAVVMILLSVSLINYIYRVDKKSMNLLVGSIFILLSEVIQLMYFYVADINILNVLCSVLLVLAFFFFYLQATLQHSTNYSHLIKDLELDSKS